MALKIFFSCSGVGIENRGIESFFREAFDGLHDTDGLEITLYKGAGEEKPREQLLWNLPRTGRTAQTVGKLIRRNGYVAEQLSTLPSMVRAIRRERPAIIFYSDSNLGFQLHRWRKQIGVPYRLLFSNGGPCHPPFVGTDYVHQVAPVYHQEAIAAGEPPERHRLLPYGIDVPAGAPDCSRESISSVRARLCLPLDREIILSVGRIAVRQKRMDYLVKEVERLKFKVGAGNRRNPYLVMLGALDAENDSVLTLARERLGVDNFTARSVPYDQVADYYRSANLFVLASLKEGFGRVFLEALIHGLPVIAHDHPVMQFVLGGEGIFGDLSREGVLADLIEQQLGARSTPEDATRRRDSVRERFSWPVLAPQYREMFYDCFEKVQPFASRS